MAKVGFFGGSFDPIHVGHLYLAITLLEKHGLDEVLFCPAALSPHKVLSAPIASGKQRLEMIRIAIEGVSFFHALDWEVVRGGVSYTIDTLRKLVSTRPKDQFYLLLGGDALKQIGMWKDSLEVCALASPLSEERSDFRVSSTDVRMRLRQNKYCGHMVPQKVLAYIQEHQLYSPL